ncbi:MAG: RDD family protein [Anaerolineae bacterium]
MSEPKPEELAPSEAANAPRTDSNARRSSTLGTAARLLVGGALLGREAIGSAMASTRDVLDEATQPPAGDEGPGEDGLAPPAQVPRPTPSARHLLIGALFDTGEQIERRGESAARTVARTASPVVRWAKRSRLTAPARRQFNALSVRGEARVQRWVERGVLEEQRSRALLNTTVTRAANRSLDTVVDSPQVQGLVEEFVEAQGQSLGMRFVEELRAQAVSGDLAVARIARRVVRHPKPEVPPLPRAVPEAAALAGAPASLYGRGAGFVSRLLAFVVDVIIVSIAIRAIEWLLQDLQMVTGWAPLPMAGSSTAGSAVPIFVTAGEALLLSAVYFLFFWSVAGITPGKGLMGLRVVRRDGSGLSFLRSLLRLFGYWLSTLLYGLGYLWIAIDNRREAWHDKIAKTAVIYAWDARPSTRSLGSIIRSAEDPESGETTGNLPPGD